MVSNSYWFVNWSFLSKLGTKKLNSNNTFLSIENKKHCIGYKIMSNNLVRSCNCERLAINGKNQIWLGFYWVNKSWLFKLFCLAHSQQYLEENKKFSAFAMTITAGNRSIIGQKPCITGPNVLQLILPVSKLVALSNDTLLFYIKLQILSQN